MQKQMVVVGKFYTYNPLHTVNRTSPGPLNTGSSNIPITLYRHPKVSTYLVCVAYLNSSNRTRAFEICTLVQDRKNKKKLQSGGASRWRVCYQRGLPRLVMTISWVLWKVRDNSDIVTQYLVYIFLFFYYNDFLWK